MNQFIKRLALAFCAATVVLLGAAYLVEDLEVATIGMPVAFICILLLAICEEEY
jgi:hypothetical protein